MSNQNDPLRLPPDNKLALSSLIRRTMVRAAEREQERSKLISVLILAQFLLTAITIAGYISSPMMIPSVFLGLVALAVYCCAYVSTRLFRRSGAAAYILVIGGGLAVAGQTLVLALGGQPLQAGQAALLFVAIILESGLLFSPEITLLTAFSTTVIAAFAVLLGLSNDHTIARSEAYFSVAFTLGLLALTALISWLLSQYIFETSLEAQRGQELQFAQARLEALSNQTEDHHRLLDESVAELLQTISRVLGGDYMVRAEIPESELTPLGESLNLLFQRYESTTHADQMRSRMDAGVLPMIESITRMPDTNTPTPNSLPIMTNTPLDSVSLVLRQMQANLNQRLGRVQRLAGEVVSSLGHSQEPLSDALNTVNEAQRMAGALIADAEKVLDTTRRQLDRILTARRMLSTLLPEEITRADITVPQTSTGELTGLGPDLGMGSSGYTGQFGAVSSLGSILEGDSTDSQESGIARMTQPLTSISPASANERRDSTDAADIGGESVLLKAWAWQPCGWSRLASLGWRYRRRSTARVGRDVEFYHADRRGNETERAIA